MKATGTAVTDAGLAPGNGAVGTAIAGTILSQDNTIKFDDDGIGVDHRDAGGMMNVTIRDNTLNAINGDDAVLDADDGIFVFIHDDIGSNVNQFNLEIINTVVNNLTSCEEMGSVWISGVNAVIEVC